MEFVLTPKGGKKILYEGFAYIHEKTRNFKSYYKCEKRTECGGRILIESNKNTISELSTHTHPPNPNRIAVIKTIAEIKNLSEKSDDIPSNIIQNATKDFPISGVTLLPKKESLSQIITRIRRKKYRNELNSFDKTFKGEPFIFLNDEQNGILILTTDKNLEMLALNKNWYADGTFNIAPIEYQVYTIHIILKNCQTVPLVYGILKNKDKKTYNLFFSFLKNKRKDLNPKNITIDFEMAAINSFLEVFESTVIYGCFFHFCQAIWRKIQEIGLQKWYKESTENSNLIKKFNALAYLPESDVKTGFYTLVESVSQESFILLKKFFIYFEKTWIGNVEAGRFQNPLFSIKMWNVYNRVLNDLPRTNNSVEGWHNAFSKRVRIKHPTLNVLIYKIKQEQNSNEFLIEQIFSGLTIKKQKKKYILINNQIKNIVFSYNNYCIMAFLTAITRNI